MAQWAAGTGCSAPCRQPAASGTRTRTHACPACTGCRRRPSSWTRWRRARRHSSRRVGVPVCLGAAGGGNYAAAWCLPDSLLRPRPEPAAPARAPTRGLPVCPACTGCRRRPSSWRRWRPAWSRSSSRTSASWQGWAWSQSFAALLQGVSGCTCSTSGSSLDSCVQPHAASQQHTRRAYSVSTCTMILACSCMPATPAERAPYLAHISVPKSDSCLQPHAASPLLRAPCPYPVPQPAPADRLQYLRPFAPPCRTRTSPARPAFNVMAGLSGVDTTNWSWQRPGSVERWCLACRALAAAGHVQATGVHSALQHEGRPRLLPCLSLPRGPLPACLHAGVTGGRGGADGAGARPRAACAQ